MAKERKPYDFEVAKAINQIVEAQEVLARSEVPVAVAVGFQQPFEIGLTPPVFHCVTGKDVSVRPFGDHYELCKVLSPLVTITTEVKAYSLNEASEQEAA